VYAPAEGRGEDQTEFMIAGTVKQQRRRRTGMIVEDSMGAGFEKGKEGQVGRQVGTGRKLTFGWGR
jgi:hypothetical protein